jgi:hypothetical protein
MGMKKRSWADQIKRARRLSNETDVFNRIRGIIGEFIGDSLESIEEGFSINHVVGLKVTLDVFKDVEEIFGGRNVYISNQTYITKDFFLELLAQYLKKHRGVDDAAIILKEFFGVIDIEKYFAPEFNLKPGQSIEIVKDREAEYKVTTQEVGQFLIDQIYRVGNKGKILWRVNWVENETVELERQCVGKEEYKKVSFSDMKEKYQLVQ